MLTGIVVAIAQHGRWNDDDNDNPDGGSNKSNCNGSSNSTSELLITLHEGTAMGILPAVLIRRK